MLPTLLLMVAFLPGTLSNYQSNLDSQVTPVSYLPALSSPVGSPAIATDLGKLPLNTQGNLVNNSTSGQSTLISTGNSTEPVPGLLTMLTNISTTLSNLSVSLLNLTAPLSNLSTSTFHFLGGTGDASPTVSSLPAGSIEPNSSFPTTNHSVSTSFYIPGGSLILDGINTTTVLIVVPNCTQDDGTCPLFPFPPGLRYISYYVTGGDAIVFGDINCGPESNLLQYRVDSEYNPIHKRAYSIFPDDVSDIGNKLGPGGYRWPGGNILYKYENQQTRDDLRYILSKAFQNYRSILPFLKFTEVDTSPGPPELGVLNIQKGTVFGPSGNKIDVCNCGVGYSPPSRSFTMDLTLDNGCDLPDIIHQIGHTLGLVHEHQRPDRESHVTFICANLNGYMQFPDPDGSPCHGQDPSVCCNPATCFGNACDLVILQGLDLSGDYDTNSVMQFDRRIFAAPGAGETLVGAGTAPSGLLYPSPLDAKRICKIYSEVCTGYCGDGMVQAGEQCDDGNNSNGDGCSATCQLESDSVSSTISIAPTIALATGIKSAPSLSLNGTSTSEVSALSTISFTAAPSNITRSFSFHNTTMMTQIGSCPRLLLNTKSSPPTIATSGILVPATPSNITAPFAFPHATTSATFQNNTIPIVLPSDVSLVITASMPSSLLTVTDTMITPFETQPTIFHVTITVTPPAVPTSATVNMGQSTSFIEASHASSLDVDAGWVWCLVLGVWGFVLAQSLT